MRRTIMAFNIVCWLHGSFFLFLLIKVITSGAVIMVYGIRSASPNDVSEENSLISHPFHTMSQGDRQRRCQEISGYTLASITACYVNIVGYGKKIALICSYDPIVVVAEDGYVYEVAREEPRRVLGIQILASETTSDENTLISHPLHTMSREDQEWQCRQISGYIPPTAVPTLTVTYVHIIGYPGRKIALICIREPTMVIAEDGYAYQDGPIIVSSIVMVDADDISEENTLRSHPLKSTSEDDLKWDCYSRALGYTPSSVTVCYVRITGYGKQIALVCTHNPMVVLAEDGFEYRAHPVDSEDSD